MPRRDYSKRKDYQALDVVNRHTLTPAGWVHEQDNTKLVLDAGGVHAIAREHAINSYAHSNGYDFFSGPRLLAPDLGIPGRRAFALGRDRERVRRVHHAARTRRRATHRRVLQARRSRRHR